MVPPDSSCRLFILICLLFIQSLSVKSFCLPRNKIISTKQRLLVDKTELEWEKELDPESFRVLRKRGTEAPFSSPLNDIKDESSGIFSCKACSRPLFDVSSKYDSGTGWPSFYAPISDRAIGYRVDFDAILPRTECFCENCGGHLGHVFDDGPNPTGFRYCMNGVAMEFDAEAPAAAVVQDPNVAARLPLESLIFGALVNLVGALLLLGSWTFSPGPSNKDLFGQLLNNTCLALGIFYIYKTVNTLLKAKR